MIKRAEEISHYESRQQSGSSHGKARFHPYEKPDRRSDKRPDKKGTSQHGRTLGRVGTGNQEAKLQVILHDQPRASSRINDNYCVTKLQTRLLARRTTPTETLDIYSHVNFPVVSHVLSATGLPQRKGLSPGLTDVKLKDCQFNSNMSKVFLLSFTCLV